MKDHVRYSKLRRQVSEEKDPKKLVELVKEISRILMEERDAMLLDKLVKAAD